MQVRHLGFFETFLYHAHQYGNSQMSVWVRLEGPVEPIHFDKAFQFILAKHPLLRSTIEKMHGVLSFRIHHSPQHIPIVHLRKKDESHFETVFEEIASQQMSLDKHNIAATVLHKQKDLNTYECDLMIHISHLVADGLSIFNLVSEIIEHIEHQISGNILSAISQPLPKPVEQCLKKKLSIPDYFKIQEDLNPKPEFEQLNTLAATNQHDKPYIRFQIKSDLLTLLTQEAKAHEVSLNSVIQIAYVHAYWKTIQKKTSVELSSAMNLRNKCTPRVPKDVCGNYFCAFGFVVDKQTLEEDFWAMAKKYHAHLTRVIQQANFLPTVYEDLPMQQTVESLMKPPTDLLEGRLGSSSMGQICFKTKKLTIIDCLVRPKNADRPNLLSYQWNDDLACVFCFPKKFRTKDWMRTLIHHFDAQLRTLPTKLSTS